jgi:hypothetical protein
MNQVTGLARKALPLDKQGLAVLDEKYKGDHRYLSLRARVDAY